MDAVIFTTIFDFAILLFIFFKKNNESLLYDITPEEQYSEAINIFDNNMKVINDLDLTDYKLGSGHIYNE